MLVELVIMRFKITFRVELPKAAEHEVFVLLSRALVARNSLPHKGGLNQWHVMMLVTIWAPTITFSVKSGDVVFIAYNTLLQYSGRSLPRKPDPGISDSEEIHFSISGFKNNLFGLNTFRPNFVRQAASLKKPVIFSTQSLYLIRNLLFSSIHISYKVKFNYPASKFRLPSSLPLTVFV